MKVLFEFSRHGIPDNLPVFEFIRDFVVSRNFKLTNDLVEDSKNSKNYLPEDVFSRLQKSISESDCVIIEGSVVSLSLGYVLTESLNLGKPVLFLIKKNGVNTTNRFAMSIKSRFLTNQVYSNISDLKKILSVFFNKNKFIKTRFNLVLPNDTNSFITKRSKDLGVSKTEYILDLIDEQMTHE